MAASVRGSQAAGAVRGDGYQPAEGRSAANPVEPGPVGQRTPRPARGRGSLTSKLVTAGASLLAVSGMALAGLIPLSTLTPVSDAADFTAAAIAWHTGRPTIELGDSQACTQARGREAPPEYVGADPALRYARTLLDVGMQAQVGAACALSTRVAEPDSVLAEGSSLIRYSSGVLAEHDGIEVLGDPSRAAAIAKQWKGRADHPKTIREPLSALPRP